MAKKKPKFLRIGYTQYSKLGLRRKKKQKYRKAKGGENKVRLKMKGHLRNVSIGFRSEKKTRGLVNGLMPIRISSVEELKKLKKNEIGVAAKIGNKKKIEVAEYALKNNMRLINLNAKKFLEKTEEERKKSKEEKAKRSEKKKTRDKKSKEAEKKKEDEENKDKKEKDEKKEGIETKVEEKEEIIKNNKTDLGELNTKNFNSQSSPSPMHKSEGLADIKTNVEEIK